MKKMKENIAKVISTAICLLLACVCLFGCGAGVKNPTEIGAPEYIDGGLHQINAVKTDKKIIENGNSNYVVVVAQDAGSLTDTVVKDMIDFIDKSAKCRLEVCVDIGLSYNANSKYLSIGETTVAEAAGIEFSREQLGSNGYRIVTKDNSVFLGGVTEYANSNAIYEFLRHTINFGAYGSLAYTYDKSDSVYLYQFDIAERPDFEWRRFTSGSMDSPSINTRRMRFNHILDVFNDIDGTDVHNFEKFASPTKYYNDHPLWFSNDEGHTQLCLNANGDTEELKALEDHIFERVKAEILAKPEREIVSFTQNDVNTWCTCEKCKASYEKYGTDAAVLIQFCNRLSERVDEWIKTNDDGLPKDKVVKICLFAYQKTEAAPVKDNGDGTYSPIDDSVVCAPNVNVFIAFLYANYTVPLNDPSNSLYAEKLNQWSALTSEMYLWIYQTNYRNYLYPYSSFKATAENYRIARKYNTTFIFNQSQYEQPLSSGFNELKVFLDSKLQWNVNLNQEELIDEWFDNYFLDAAKPMREFFDSVFTWLDYVHSDLRLGGGVYADISKAEYWPVKMVEGYLDKIEESYQNIKKYETTDPVLYNSLYDRICLESLFPRYVLATLHTGNFSNQGLNEFRSELAADITRLNVKFVGEREKASDIIDGWNV